MAKISRFEDIEAWQESRALTKAIYAVTRGQLFARDRGLTEQLQRASVSVMTNIVEGFDSGSTAEFIRFLGYSRRSASEIQSHLYVARDQDYLDNGNFTSLYEQAEKVRRMVTSFMGYLKAVRDGRSATR